ncbi:MAG: hypothetical protein ACE5ID_03120 [Acidobacteriota bacterium]
MRMERARILAGAFRVVGALALLGLAPASALQAGPAKSPPIPPKTKAIFHFDLARLRQSDLYAVAEEKIGPLARSNDKLHMFLEATGLSSAVASLSAFTLYSFFDVADPAAFAGVISGDFGPEAIKRLEDAYAPVARKVDGHVIMPVVQTPEFELVMSFPGPGRLSFGTAKGVEMLSSATENDSRLMKAYERTDTDRPVWGVINARQVINSLNKSAGENDRLGPSLGLLQNSPALNALSAVGFSIDLGRDIFFEFRALTENAESARLLADAVKGLVALGQMGAAHGTDPDVLDFFRQMVAESERDGVYFSFSLTEAQIQKMKAQQDFLAGLVPR